MPAHPQGHGFQSQVQQVRGNGCHGAAKIPQQLHPGLGDIGRFSKLFRINHTMIALIGGGQLRELSGGLPIKGSAIDHHAPQHIGMTIHIFAGGVGDDIRAEIKGTAEEGGCKGIIHNQRNPMPVGDGRVTGNVQHRQGGVGDGLAEDKAGILVKLGIHLIVRHLIMDITDLNAHSFHGDGEQVDGAAVDIVQGNEILTGGADIEHRQQIGRLTGGNQHGPHAALQIG